MKNNYDIEKKEIFERSKERTAKIMSKYIERQKGQLDGEPWKDELKEDSKIVLEELKELKEKYNKDAE